MDFKIGGKVVSIDNEKLKEALENNAENLDLGEDLIVRTQEEQDAFLGNVKKESIKTALEMEVKKWRNDLDLSFEGKTVENLINAVTEKNKTEFTKDPSKKLEEKDTDIKTLQAKLTEAQQSKEQLQGQFVEYKNSTKKKTVLASAIPDNVILPKEDMIMIMENKLNPSFDEDGRMFFKGKDGSPLKDDQLNYLGAEKVAEKFFSENPTYLKQAQGGAGGSDSGGDINDKSVESFNKRYEAQGGEVGTMEYNQKLTQAVQSGDVKV